MAYITTSGVACLSATSLASGAAGGEFQIEKTSKQTIDGSMVCLLVYGIFAILGVHLNHRRITMRKACKHCGSLETKGYIYACKNPAWKGWIKIGKAINLPARLSGLNVGSPHKDFEIIHTIKSPKTKLKSLEKKILLASMLESRESRGEWRKISDKKIINLFDKTKTIGELP